MKKTGIIETLDGMDFMIIFSLLFVSAIVIVWCLTSAVAGPFEHLSCPLLSIF
jgi:hypothetical protein